MSRSGTLTYEGVGQLTAQGLGQSTCIGIGGDPIIGTNFIDALRLFHADPGYACSGHGGRNRRRGGRGGRRLHQEKMKKPVVGFIAGQTAPPGGDGTCGRHHFGRQGYGGGKDGRDAEPGIHVVTSPADIGEAVANALKESQ